MDGIIIFILIVLIIVDGIYSHRVETMEAEIKELNLRIDHLNNVFGDYYMIQFDHYKLGYQHGQEDKEKNEVINNFMR